MTKKIEDGGLAFPGKRMEEIGFVNIGGDIEKTVAEAEHPGMSLRDWFAGKVLACVDWSSSDVREISDDELVSMCHQVYRIADAMIIARKAGEA